MGAGSGGGGGNLDKEVAARVQPGTFRALLRRGRDVG